MAGISLRPAKIDDISAIRYVHSAATRACAAHHLGDDDVETLASAINREEYVHAVAGSDLTAAWVGGELVGTVGWKPTGAAPDVARLQMLFVWPLFAGAGIGRLLVSHAEADAHAAGYRSVRVRTTIQQAPFFKRLGYVMTAQSALRTGSGGRLPIAYLRKDEICPDFPITESAWGDAGRRYHH
ncbi:GNAT family N-acetyltransferase [Dichotomicrobium thermohalophilum]|uniref:GNAT family N-acetyltransferase n=1 Tax=Dichotomicrobium thermohalophilum TaxID=933063 RepID=UPI0014743FC6|nr:GNAT family N-acetyltransferase [Dichotomicrobium thermohalophilum]